MEEFTEFVETITKKYPSLNLILLEHRKYFDCVLVHIFCGDIVRFLEENYSINKIIDIQDFYLTIEEYLKYGHENVKELLWASFLENIEPQSNLYVYTNKYFGQEMTIAYKTIWNIL